MRATIISVCLLMAGVSAANGQMTTVINDNFESGLSGWSQGAATPWPIDLNSTPIIFEENDPLLHQRDGVTHATHSAGFASNLNPWDYSLAVWLEKRFVGAATPGTVHVHLEMDRYVYKDPNYRDIAPDPYAVSNRIFLLTDAYYASPCLNFDGSLPGASPPGPALRSSYNAGTDASPSLNSGVWMHYSVDRDMATTTGNFELRLLMHEKYSGAEAVAWDNINLTIDGVQILLEDFENGLDGWTVRSFEANHPHDDTPFLFAANDPRLFINTGNPGSTTAGFTSSLSCPDTTRAAWLYQRFPNLESMPGTFAVSVEADVYVYKDPAQLSADAQALGNRIFVLTDDDFANPNFDYTLAAPAHGLAAGLWRGDNDGAVNGLWQHVSLYQDLASTTGNFEVRLLMNDKIPVVSPSTTLPEPSLWSVAPGDQAVAWDNVVVRIGPPCHTPRFDHDGDGDVDGTDFAFFQTCFTGAEAEAISNFPQCRCMRGDSNNTIDSQDLIAFIACWSGPSVPADPICDERLPLP